MGKLSIKLSLIFSNLKIDIKKLNRLANKYNRLVLYRGDHFHMSMDYFGQDLYDSRLFQTFFFDTEI